MYNLEQHQMLYGKYQCTAILARNVPYAICRAKKNQLPKQLGIFYKIKKI